MSQFECKCGRLDYYCNCRTLVLMPHQPMTSAEARAVIISTFGEAEAARIFEEAKAG